MSLLVPSPYQLFADRYGDALNGGYIYIGGANQSPQAFPITVYWDSALTIPAAQPIRTSGGYPVRPGATGTPANIFVPGPYSILIQDKNQGLVFSHADPIADQASGILTLLKTVDGSGSGLISEGLRSIQITDLNFDPTLLGLADREVRAYSTSFGPANQPNNSVVDYFNITLTRVDATSFILSMDGLDLNTNPTGGHFTRYWTAGAWGGWRWVVDQYDFVVDSNQALDQWAAHTGGLYRRVLVKRGAWVASSFGPTAGVLIDLDITGTSYVFAEEGSSITISAGFAGVAYGMRHTAAATPDPTVEKFSGINLSITNTTATRNAYAFSQMNNLQNCKGTGTGSTSGAGVGFQACNFLDGCIGMGNGGNTTGQGSGINGCFYISNSFGQAVALGTGIATGLEACTTISNSKGDATSVNGKASAFFNCSLVSGCDSTTLVSGTGNANGFEACSEVTSSSGFGRAGTTGTGSGFNGCSGVSSSRAEGRGGSVSGPGYGFNTCIGVVNNRGVGTAAGAGVGYGFFGSTKCQQNRPNGASKTATYNTSFADSAAANACADTAAGGYNS